MTDVTDIATRIEGARDKPTGRFGKQSHTQPSVSVPGGELRPHHRGMSGTITVPYTERRGLFRRANAATMDVPVVLSLPWLWGEQALDGEGGERIVSGQARRPAGLEAAAPDEQVIALLWEHTVVETAGLSQADAKAAAVSAIRETTRRFELIDDQVWGPAHRFPPTPRTSSA